MASAESAGATISRFEVAVANCYAPAMSRKSPSNSGNGFNDIIGVALLISGSALAVGTLAQAATSAAVYGVPMLIPALRNDGMSLLGASVIVSATATKTISASVTWLK